jgi:phosphatidylserine/phosphatidylglycerophosphate/cardiolipin synthase-like enzyme
MTVHTWIERTCLCVALACALPVHAAEFALPASAHAEVAFSPEGKALDVLLKEVGSARRSIRVAAYLFTSKPIATALVSATERGVDVRVVADAAENRKRFTAVKYLANAGVPVRLNDRYGIHHHKFMVIDGRDVQTGSFNYTASAATRNAENILIVRGAPELAKAYAKEWQRLWDEAVPLAPAY